MPLCGSFRAAGPAGAIRCDMKWLCFHETGPHECGDRESWFRSFLYKAKKGQQPAGRWGRGRLTPLRGSPIPVPLEAPGPDWLWAARPLLFPWGVQYNRASGSRRAQLRPRARPGVPDGARGTRGPGGRHGPDIPQVRRHSEAAPRQGKGAPGPTLQTPQTPRWRERPGRAGTRRCAGS